MSAGFSEPRVRKFLNTVLLTAVLGLNLGSARAASSPEISGAPIIQSVRGKVVLLDFWASWCAPCRKSFPWMNALQKKYGDKGLTVIAVNLDAEQALAAEFLQAIPAQFRVEYDPKGELATRLNITAMPTSFLLDRSGRIVQQHAGFRDAQLAAREQEIEQLLRNEP